MEFILLNHAINPTVGHMQVVVAAVKLQCLQIQGV